MCIFTDLPFIPGIAHGTSIYGTLVPGTVHVTVPGAISGTLPVPGKC